VDSLIAESSNTFLLSLFFGLYSVGRQFHAPGPIFPAFILFSERFPLFCIVFQKWCPSPRLSRVFVTPSLLHDVRPPLPSATRRPFCVVPHPIKSLSERSSAKFPPFREAGAPRAPSRRESWDQISARRQLLEFLPFHVRIFSSWDTAKLIVLSPLVLRDVRRKLKTPESVYSATDIP